MTEPKFVVGKPFRDITALEVLRSGESEAHEQLLQSALGFERIAKTIDARFAAIEARLKALEERWSPDTAPVHHVSEELREKLAREAEETNERREASVGEHEG